MNEDDPSGMLLSLNAFTGAVGVNVNVSAELIPLVRNEQERRPNFVHFLFPSDS